jgi:hypothetical protein
MLFIHTQWVIERHNVMQDGEDGGDVEDEDDVEEVGIDIDREDE